MEDQQHGGITNSTWYAHQACITATGKAWSPTVDWQVTGSEVGGTSMVTKSGITGSCSSSSCCLRTVLRPWWGTMMYVRKLGRTVQFSVEVTVNDLQTVTGSEIGGTNIVTRSQYRENAMNQCLWWVCRHYATKALIYENAQLVVDSYWHLQPV